MEDNIETFEKELNSIVGICDEKIKRYRALLEECQQIKGSALSLLNLKGTRRQNKGRKLNRKLNGFPYNKLSQFIEYKARWLGIKVLRVSERKTSKACRKCGAEGIRVGSSFRCPKCGYRSHADYNGL